MRVFDAPVEFLAIAEELTLVIMAGEEPSPELLERVATLKKEGPASIDNWVNTIQEVEGGIETIKKREGQLYNKRVAMNKTVAYMRDILTNVVDTVCEGKFKGEWSVYTQDKKGMEVEVINPALVPPAYWEAQPAKFKLADAKAALKTGVQIPGLRVTETSTHGLTIRS